MWEMLLSALVRLGDTSATPENQCLSPSIASLEICSVWGQGWHTCDVVPLQILSGSRGPSARLELQSCCCNSPDDSSLKHQSAAAQDNCMGAAECLNWPFLCSENLTACTIAYQVCFQVRALELVNVCAKSLQICGNTFAVSHWLQSFNQSKPATESCDLLIFHLQSAIPCCHLFHVSCPHNLPYLENSQGDRELIGCSEPIMILN